MLLLGVNVVLSDVVLASTIRLATHPRMMNDPSGPDVAFDAVDEIRSGPASVVVLITLDRGFAPFEGLRTLNPVA